MAQFRKKPVVVEATQWFKNGDHPQDECSMVHPDENSTTQFEPFLSEGKVVRHFRHPSPAFAGNEKCGYCGKIHHDHGWIDTVQGGHTVCPGDWIIIEGGNIKLGYYPCKPDVFDKTYEPVS